MVGRWLQDSVQKQADPGGWRRKESSESRGELGGFLYQSRRACHDYTVDLQKPELRSFCRRRRLTEQRLEDDGYFLAAAIWHKGIALYYPNVFSSFSRLASFTPRTHLYHMLTRSELGQFRRSQDTRRVTAIFQRLLCDMKQLLDWSWMMLFKINYPDILYLFLLPGVVR